MPAIKGRKKAEEGKHTVNSNITADSTEDSIMPAIKERKKGWKVNILLTVILPQI